MSVSTIANRTLLGIIRTTLNSWAAAINTLITDVNLTESDIATLQGEMTTAQADILLRQLKDSKSTLNDGFRATAISITVLNTDINNIIQITNTAPTNVTLVAPSTLVNAANDGSKVLIYNKSTSTNTVTLVPSGCTLIGNTAVTQGQTVWIIRTGASEWTRLLFA